MSTILFGSQETFYGLLGQFQCTSVGWRFFLFSKTRDVSVSLFFLGVIYLRSSTSFSFSSHFLGSFRLTNITIMPRSFTGDDANWCICKLQSFVRNLVVWLVVHVLLKDDGVIRRKESNLGNIGKKKLVAVSSFVTSTARVWITYWSFPHCLFFSFL